MTRKQIAKPTPRRGKQTRSTDVVEALEMQANQINEYVSARDRIDESPIEPKTENQKRYLNSMKSCQYLPHPWQK